MADEKTITSPAEGKEKVVKARHWVGIIYPESMPENWEQIIEESHVPCVLSPLHDKDINPDGEPKKPHYHIMISYANTTTNAGASKLLARLGSSLHAERVESPVGQYRYLTHRDNPEKAQYSEKDIRKFNGWDYVDVIGKRSNSEELKLSASIIDIIESDVCPLNYFSLLRYLRMEGLADEWDYAVSHTYFVQGLLTSARNLGADEWDWARRHGLVSENGEVVEREAEAEGGNDEDSQA